LKPRGMKDEFLIRVSCLAPCVGKMTLVSSWREEEREREIARIDRRVLGVIVGAMNVFSCRARRTISAEVLG